MRLEKGDLVRLVTGHGGGYGNPRKRARDKVANDLKNGYVTSEQAQDLYAYEAGRTPANTPVGTLTYQKPE